MNFPKSAIPSDCKDRTCFVEACWRLFAQMLVNRMSIQYVASCVHLGPASRIDSLGSLSQLVDARWQNMGRNGREVLAEGCNVDYARDSILDSYVSIFLNT